MTDNTDDIPDSGRSRYDADDHLASGGDEPNAQIDGDADLEDEFEEEWSDESGLPEIHAPTPDDQRSHPPLIWGRDTVKQFRTQKHMFLQTETNAAMNNAENYFKQKYPDQTVLALDVREAITLAGLLNIDDADAFMQAWGYGENFDF